MTPSLLEELERDSIPVPARARRGKLRILLLEDQEADRMRMIRVIRQSGLDADVTEIAALDPFRAELDRMAYDLVFIDYWLGFENGLDALQLLLAHPTQMRAIPIMLSRATEPHVIIEAMRAGCADYIVKDKLDVENLRACIAAAFERRILMAAMREGKDLRVAIRRFVERLGRGKVQALAEQGASYSPPKQPPGRLSASAGERLSMGLMADLEWLWSLRR